MSKTMTDPAGTPPAPTPEAKTRDIPEDHRKKKPRRLLAWKCVRCGARKHLRRTAREE